jgi:hypothetical protein
MGTSPYAEQSLANHESFGLAREDASSSRSDVSHVFGSRQVERPHPAFEKTQEGEPAVTRKRQEGSSRSNATSKSADHFLQGAFSTVLYDWLCKTNMLLCVECRLITNRTARNKTPLQKQ